MNVINNRGEGMTFIINSGTSIDKLFKIKKYYPNASIKIEIDEKPKPKVSVEELKMLGLLETDVDPNLIIDKKTDKKITEKLTIKNLKKYFGEEIVVKNTQPLAS